MKRPFFLSSPWFLGACLTAANILLSYFPFSWEFQFFIVMAGIIFPLTIAGSQVHLKKDSFKSLTQSEFLPPLPLGFFFLLGVATLYLRFHQLTTLSRWPGDDESVNAYYALELAEKGNWQWTYLFSGMPPLYIWLLGSCFKLFGVSLKTLWGPPAVLSFLALGLIYAGARKFFSDSLSLVLTALTAFSFWPLYLARFSVQGQIMFFWMSVLLYLYGLFWKYRMDKAWERSGIALGLGVGLGFYTYTSWVIVALLVTGAVFYLTHGGSKRRWDVFLLYLVPTALLFLPLGWAVLIRGGGNFFYVFQNPLGQGLPGLNDFCSFFWGGRLTPNFFAYRPFWGGFLNPLLGALCFLGIFTAIKSGFSPWKLGAFFFLLILPGFISGGMDSNRVVQALPFLLLGSALGLAALLARLPKAWRLMAGGILLSFSMALDAHHLFDVYGSLWTQPRDNWFAIKSVERLRAFGLLEEISKKQGPGFVLSELVPDTYDQSLSVLDYPFNCAQNPRLSAISARWAAILTNIHYEPYLSRQFPGGRGFWLASDAGFSDGGLMLYVISLPCAQMETLRHWIEADRAFHGLAGQVFDNRDWKPRTPIIQSLIQDHPLLGQDRFLNACFWEKIADNEYWDHQYGAQVTALQQDIEKGIPTAHLYNNLGALYLRHHRYPEARVAFEKALQCIPDHTSAAEGLEMLNQIEKTRQSPKDSI